ncbi:MAG: response regulator [Nitrospirota bacterium]|nr:MAG: response regulator [Nitrospirota bacterium]
MRKILIVDPLKSSLEKKVTSLTKQGLQVSGVESAQEALELIRKDPVDVIISELDMPGMNGDELCSSLRKRPELKNISVILTGFESQSAKDRSNTCGANAYLSKPLSPKDLSSQVNDLLNIHGRESYRVLMKVTVKSKIRKESFFCTSHNLSVSGVLLETEKVLEPGVDIECAFFLRSVNISVNGEVVREEKKSQDVRLYGIKFIDLSQDNRNLIEDFVRSRNPGGDI